MGDGVGVGGAVVCVGGTGFLVFDGDGTGRAGVGTGRVVGTTGATGFPTPEPADPEPPPVPAYGAGPRVVATAVTGTPVRLDVGGAEAAADAVGEALSDGPAVDGGGGVDEPSVALPFPPPPVR